MNLLSNGIEISRKTHNNNNNEGVSLKTTTITTTKNDHTRTPIQKSVWIQTFRRLCAEQKKSRNSSLWFSYWILCQTVDYHMILCYQKPDSFFFLRILWHLFIRVFVSSILLFWFFFPFTMFGSYSLHTELIKN